MEGSGSYSRPGPDVQEGVYLIIPMVNGSVVTTAQRTTLPSGSNIDNVYSSFIAAVKQQNVTAVKNSLDGLSEEDRKTLCNQQSADGLAPLIYAAHFHNEELTDLLLEHGADVGPLITLMPAVADAALTRCLKPGLGGEGETKAYLCDYKLLKFNTPSSSSQAVSDATKSEMHKLGDTYALYIMLLNKREDLLMHPLTYSYVKILWQLNHGILLKSVAARLMYLLVLISFLVFWLPVNYLFVVKKFPNGTEVPTWAPEFQCKATHLAWNLSTDITQLSYHEVCSEIIRYQENCTFLPVQRHVYAAYAVRSILLIFSMVGSGMTVYDFSQQIATISVSADYFLSVLICGVSIAVTIPWEMPWDGWVCYYDYALLTNWRWQCASLNILLACVYVASLFRYVGRIGLYVQMLTEVTKTMLRVLPTVFLILGGFALTFHFLFKASIRHAQRSEDIEGIQANPFYTVYQAFVKTLAMFTGELTLDEHFSESNLFWPVFVLAMLLLVGTIALMNLLTGLAVTDISILQERATLQRVTSRASYMINEARCGQRFTSVPKAKLSVTSGVCKIETLNPKTNEYESMTTNCFIGCLRWISEEIGMSMQDENRKLGLKVTELFKK